MKRVWICAVVGGQGLMSGYVSLLRPCFKLARPNGEQMNPSLTELCAPAAIPISEQYSLNIRVCPKKRWNKRSRASSQATSRRACWLLVSSARTLLYEFILGKHGTLILFWAQCWHIVAVCNTLMPRAICCHTWVISHFLTSSQVFVCCIPFYMIMSLTISLHG